MAGLLELAFPDALAALNGNRIIEFGANERKTHPRYPDYKYSTHAEIKLLLNLKKDESKMKKVTDMSGDRRSRASEFINAGYTHEELLQDKQSILHVVTIHGS